MTTAFTRPRTDSLTLARIARLATPWVFALAFTVFAAQVLQNWTYLEDDCLIFFRYALQFHAGHGWVMNPGERVNGCTSPFALWLITALTAGLSPDWSIFALKVLGVGCGIAILLCARALTLALLPGQGLVAALVPLLIAYRLDFTLSMINGLETPYACAALLGGVLAFWKAEEKQSLKIEAIAVALFVIAGLSRPEMTILYPALWLARLVIHRRANWLLLAYLVPFAALAVFLYSYYGDVLPNTYYAKKANFSQGLELGGKYLHQHLVLTPTLLSPWFFVVAVGAAAWRNLKLSWIPLLVGVLCAATVLRTHGDWMADGRFAVPVLPLFLMAWVVGVYAFLDALRPAWYHVPRLAAIVIIYLVIKSSWRGYDELARSVAANVVEQAQPAPFALPNGDLSTWMCGRNDGRRVISDWISKNVTSGQSVLYSEMGITTVWNPNVRFIDVYGLTDKTVARMSYPRQWVGVVAAQDWYKPHTEMGRYIAQRKPDFVILPDVLVYGEPVQAEGYEFVKTIEAFFDHAGVLKFSVHKRTATR